MDPLPTALQIPWRNAFDSYDLIYLFHRYQEVEGVGVMKDEEIKIEEIEVSHTLGGAGRCYAVVIHT